MWHAPGVARRRQAARDRRICFARFDPVSSTALWHAALQGAAGGWAAATPAGGSPAAGEDSDGDADLVAVPWSTRGKAAGAASSLRRLRKGNGGDNTPAPQQDQQQQSRGAPADAAAFVNGAQPTEPDPSPSTGQGAAARAQLRLQPSSPHEAHTDTEPWAGVGPSAAAAEAAGDGAATAAAAKPKGNPFARAGGAGKGSVSARGEYDAWGLDGACDACLLVFSVPCYPLIQRHGTHRPLLSSLCHAAHHTGSWHDRGAGIARWGWRRGGQCSGPAGKPVRPAASPSGQNVAAGPAAGLQTPSHGLEACYGGSGPSACSQAAPAASSCHAAAASVRQQQR